MDIIQGLVQAGSTAGRPALRIVSNNRTFDIINTVTSNVIFSILNDGSVGAGSTIYTNLITNYADSGSGSSGGTVVSSLPDTLFTTNPTGVSSGTIGTTDRYYIFTHTGGYNTNTGYTVSIPAGITFDLFMIGGGGAGGGIGGAGGGSGACLVALNQTIAAGNYGFVVGGAGSGGITGSGNIGYDTYIGNNIYKARGGGGGAADARNGIVGGSSGGAAGGVNNTVYTSPAPATDNYYQSQASGPVVNTTSLYSIYGNKGGNASATNTFDLINYGGGGGIGAAATDGTTTLKATTGGDGLYQVSLNNTSYNLRTYFTNNGTFGVQDGATGNYFIGGGGGAGGYNPSITPINIAGGKGGGGIGKNGNSPANGTDGAPNTGSGGGAGSTGAGGNSFGGNGGSGLLIFRYRNTSNVSTGGSGAGVSSQWTTVGTKIYYNLGNIGIGATDPIAPLHIYNATNARLLLDATTTGTATLEFRRGTGGDAQNDFRFINDSNSSFKLQCENPVQVFGNAIADLAWFSSNETIIHKNTTMNGRVGVGTVYHATRTLDVVGDANVSGTVSVGNLNISSSNSVTITNTITSNTILAVGNSLVPLPNEIAVPSPIPNEIVVAGTTFGTIGTTDRYIQFPYSGSATTKDYTFTTTENLICDILVVGGGGCGGRSGGGGGTVLYTQNVFYPTGTYTVKVANGGISLKTGGVGNTQGANGADSDILFGATTIFRAKGGGLGAANGTAGGGSVTGGTGGSGGGSESVGTNGAVSNGNIISTNTSSSTFTILTNQSPNGSTIRGNIGGIGAIKMPNYYYYVGGGGGGAGGAGGNGDTTNNISGAGGAGVNIDIIGSGTPIMYGSGGAGGVYNDFNQGNVPATSGAVTAGGGTGAYATTTQSIFGSIPTAGRGGGGGGWSVNALTNEQIYARDGGSGIVIIRYRKPASEIVTSSIIPGTTDRYLSFPYSGSATTKDYTITTTEDLVCDVLVVGGGGGGARRMGGGGGAGALIYATGMSLNTGAYIIKVGNGGAGSSTSGNLDNSSRLPIKRGESGYDSEIYFQNTSSTPIYRAKGGSGGLGGDTGSDVIYPNEYFPLPGGSGGGNGGKDGGAGGLLSALNIVNGLLVSVINNSASDSVNPSYVGGQCFGNEGGRGGGNNPWLGSGGGGAGSKGTDVNNVTQAQLIANNTAGIGGDGKLINITGSVVAYAGGGGGGTFGYTISAGNDTGGSQYYNDGGIGGGGRSGTLTVSPVAGTDGTGGGGGGDGPDVFSGARGGSGIVIIRYRRSTTSSTATINLVRGTVADANHDYRVGNYNGEFKIVSSVSSQDTDYIRITTAGAITNPTGTASWNTGSDRRIKENIERASYDKCYENINKLELNRFNYVSGFNTVNRDKTQLGFIAQEVNDIFPKAISSQEYYTNELCIPDLLSIDITQINYSLYGAVKKLIKINKDQETRFDTFDRRLKTIETALNIVTEPVVLVEPVTSNIIIEPSTSNIIVDLIEPTTSNITVDIIVDPIEPTTSNITVDIIVDPIEPTTSNIIVDPIEPTTSNIIVDPIEPTTSNLTTE